MPLPPFILILKNKLNRLIADALIFMSYYLKYFSERYPILSFMFFIFKLFLKVLPLTPYSAISHIKYAESHPLSKISILRNRTYGHVCNIINDFDKEDQLLYTVDLPNVFISSHQHVIIQGNSDFIIDKKGGYAINDIAYNIKPNIELFDGLYLNQKENVVLLWYNNYSCTGSFDSGIMLCGRFSKNYYHILYEILIKLILIKDANIPNEVPLIIDDIVYKVNSFRCVFNLLNQTNRKIITIGPNDFYLFKKLYWVSAVNIIPPHHKRYEDFLQKKIYKSIVFDLDILKIMRNKLIRAKSTRVFPRRIFLLRKKNRWRHFNEDEVLQFLTKYDFYGVSPEEYSFNDQVALFNNAEFIIGGSGAAFSNLIFCTPGCKVISFKSRATYISAFAPIAYSQNVTMRFFVAKPKNSLNRKKIHSDFWVDLEKLERMIELMIE